MVVREDEEEAVKIMFRLHEEDGETASPAFRAASRTNRVLRAAQQCLHNDDLYMHHSKLNMKAAIEGSASLQSCGSSLPRQEMVKCRWQ